MKAVSKDNIPADTKRILNSEAWYDSDMVEHIVRVEKCFGNAKASYVKKLDVPLSLADDRNKILLSPPKTKEHTLKKGDVLLIRNDKAGKISWQFKHGKNNAKTIQSSAVTDFLEDKHKNDPNSFDADPSSILKYIVDDAAQVIINPETRVIFNYFDSSPTGVGGSEPKSMNVKKNIESRLTNAFDILAHYHDEEYASFGPDLYTIEPPKTFAFSVSLANNHMVPVICNTKGEIIIGTSIDNKTYRQYNQRIYDRIKAAFTKYNIPDQGFMQLNTQQKDSHSCSVITAEVLRNLDPNKELKEQLDNLEQVQRQTCEHPSAARQMHKDALAIHYSLLADAAIIDYDNPLEKNNAQKRAAVINKLNKTNEIDDSANADEYLHSKYNFVRDKVIQHRQRFDGLIVEGNNPFVSKKADVKEQHTAKDDDTLEAETKTAKARTAERAIRRGGQQTMLHQAKVVTRGTAGKAFEQFISDLEAVAKGKDYLTDNLEKVNDNLYYLQVHEEDKEDRRAVKIERVGRNLEIKTESETPAENEIKALADTIEQTSAKKPLIDAGNAKDVSLLIKELRDRNIEPVVSERILKKLQDANIAMDPPPKVQQSAGPSAKTRQGLKAEGGERTQPIEIDVPKGRGSPGSSGPSKLT